MSFVRSLGHQKQVSLKGFGYSTLVCVHDEEGACDAL